MQISYKWLCDYIKTDIEIEKIAEILTDTGLEVEGLKTYSSIKGGLKGVVVGEVLEKEKHPNADKLNITKVNVGTSTLLTIVCGAPNVAVGQKVPVATIGTILYPNEQGFEIKKAKIRGQVSEGMICAEDELGIGKSHDGIMVLPKNTKVGMPFAEYLNLYTDTIIEIGLTPNRTDAISHIGVARDLKAALRKNNNTIITNPEKINIDKLNGMPECPINIEIQNTDACKRYSGIFLGNIEVKESPEWIKNRLLAIGLKPINNVVDITNYVMHETGQPLHAFDAKQISGNKIIVKTLQEKTKFTTLDDIEIELSEQDLMICDAEKGLCIAGVYGGKNSGVTNKTKNLFLESANFDAVFVRKTSKRHDLKTDSAFRFERGCDPNQTVDVMMRAVFLLEKYANAQITTTFKDIYPKIESPKKINITLNYIYKIIGKQIPEIELIEIMEALDIEVVSVTDNEYQLTIPTYRTDVSRPADVVEEILRIYGMNNIEIADTFTSSISFFCDIEWQKLKQKIATGLAYDGFSEIMSNSLSQSNYYSEEDKNTLVNICNPLSTDLNIMRKTMLYSGLEAVSHNANRKQTNLKLYEFGKTYCKNNPQSHSEQFNLALFVTGKRVENHWNEPNADLDFYYLKGQIEKIFSIIGILPKIKFNPYSNKDISEGIECKIKKNTIAIIGYINTKILQKFDINQPVVYANIFWDELQKNYKPKQSFKPIPKFPEVKRDLALLVDEHVSFDALKKIAYNKEPKLLKDVQIFDIYTGDKIENGKKSYALSFILQDENNTLTDKTIDTTMQKLSLAFEKQAGAVIR